jgi:hypothetical protein
MQREAFSISDDNVRLATLATGTAVDPHDKATFTWWRVRVELAVPETSSPGSHVASVLIRSGTAKDPVTVPVRWQVLPRLTCEPSEIFFGIVPRVQRAASKLVLASNDNSLILNCETVHITHTLGNDLTVTTQPGQLPNTVIVACAFDATSVPGPRHGKLEVSLPDNSVVLSLPINAYVR